MNRLIFHIISGILGLYLAAKFVDGVEFSGRIKILIIAGIILGLVNFFVRPILKLITFPITILTFGLFGLVINMMIVWVVADILFPKEIEIIGLLPLFWTTLIILALNLLFGLYSPKKYRSYQRTSE